MNILMDQNYNVRVLLNSAAMKVSSAEMGVVKDGGEVTGDMPEDGVMTAETGVKDPILSSWPFVIGISAITLAVSILFGLLLAKRKIKKGYELYED